MRPLGCAVTSPEVEVAGVVDGDDEPIAEFNVEDDLRRDRKLPFCPFAWPLLCAWPFFSSVLMFDLLFLRRLLRKEGITGSLPILDSVDA